MCTDLCIVNEAMKAYYVKKDENDIILVHVFHEVCYEKYSKDYF